MVTSVSGRVHLKCGKVYERCSKSVRYWEVHLGTYKQGYK